jgi:tRNA (cmo5U34)-methyltransferase
LENADLSSEGDSEIYDALLRIWQRVMVRSDWSVEGLSRKRAAYTNDVAVLPPAVVASIIQSAGFGPPVQFFQAGLIHARFARRVSGNAAL